MTVRNSMTYYMCLFILLFSGMCFQISGTDSSFSYVHDDVIEEAIGLIDSMADAEESCTNEMLGKQTVRVRRNNEYKHAVHVNVSEAFKPHLTVYMLEEAKEDGQIFLNRAIFIDYIHLVDGEIGVPLFC